MNKVNFGVIVTTRRFFSAGLAIQAREKIVGQLQAHGYGVVIPPEGDTYAGAVGDLSDADVYARYFMGRIDQIDGIIVVLANFGDEVSVAEAIARSRLNVPVLVVACADEIDKMDLPHRRDAFCGKLSVCNNLYQRNIKFSLTKSHTVDIGGEELSAELAKFAAVCRVVNGLRSLRVGAVGARPNDFHTVRFSEKLLQASGINTVVTDLSDIIAKAEAIDCAGNDADCAGAGLALGGSNNSHQTVSGKIDEINKYGVVSPTVGAEKLRKLARLSIALENWFAGNKCGAGAVQCWDSVQYNYGCAVCAAMSMMGEAGIPCACEMDVTGAVTMYALYMASGRQPGYLDWNNNYGSDHPDMCVCLHCSNFPKSFFGGEDIEIGDLDVLSTTIDAEKCFGACKGRVAPGNMTFAKITTDDRNGKIKAYIGEGEFVRHEIDTKGGVALCRVPELQTLMQYICSNGFEHHVAMCRGNVADVMEEAMRNYLGWDVYRSQ